MLPFREILIIIFNKVKRLSMLFGLICIPLLNYGQIGSSSLLIDTLKFQNTLIASFLLDVNSNALNNEFVNTYYQGGFISSEIKNNTYTRMSGVNRFGLLLKNDLEWNHEIANSTNPTSVFVKLAQYSINEMQFTDELFKLIFFGNNDFIEKSVNFSNSSFQSLNYLQLKAGLTYQFIEKAGMHQIQVAMGLNLGQNHTAIQVKRGSFYTQTNGEHVNLDLDANIQQSDTARKDFLDFNGWGPNLDFSYQYTFSHKNSIGFSIENFGYIEWNKNSFDTHADTTLNFQGVEVDNIYKISSDIFNRKLDDLKNELAYKSYKKQYITYTPAKFYVFYTQPIFKNRLIVKFEGGNTFFSCQKPYFKLQAKYNFSPNIYVTPMIQFGGYGSLNIGAMIGINPWRDFSFIMYSQYLNSIISPSSSGGEGIGVSLIKHFKTNKRH